MGYAADMRIAVYQPDMPPNLGAMLRLGACLGVPVDVIEPCGFPFGGKGDIDKRARRAGMDYVELAEFTRHASWQAFETARQESAERLVLLTTAAKADYLDFEFLGDDILLLGRESAGVPAEVHDAAEARIRVVMQPGARSLNVVNAAAMVLGEALRQTRREGNKD